MAGIYGDATQYLSLWSIAPVCEIVLRLTLPLLWLQTPALLLFLSWATGAPVSLRREAGNSAVKSPLIRLGMCETLVVSRPWEPRRTAACWASSGSKLSFLNSSCSRWLLIGVGCCLRSPIKRGRVARRGGLVWQRSVGTFSTSVSVFILNISRNPERENPLLADIINWILHETFVPGFTAVDS